MAALAAGCGGPVADLLDGRWDVEVLDKYGEPRCTGSMTIAVVGHVELTGTAELCGSEGPEWSGKLGGRVTDLQRADLVLGSGERPLRVGGATFDPSWIQGNVPIGDGGGIIRAFRHGARVGKTMPPPLD